MTRFMIDLNDAIKMVWHALEDTIGGEIYVKKCPSMKIIEIADVISSDANKETIGIRPGEKLHEQMIGHDDAPYTYEYDNYYKILPSIYSWSEDPKRINLGKLVPNNFSYTSDNNKEWMTKKELSKWIEINKNLIDKI